MRFIHRLLHAILPAALALAPAGAAPAPFAFPLAGGETQARQALDLLGKAAEHGLDPERYGRAGLARRLDAARDGSATAALERDLGAAMLRYLAELHAGRGASAYRAAGGAGGFDAEAHLERALREGSLERAVDEAAPAIPLYRRVMASLAQYRDLARRHPDWPPLPAAGRGIAVGEAYAGAQALGRRLQLLGDLDRDDGAGAGAGHYTAALAAGIKRFQARHGLAEDGVPGPRTMAALAVPPAHRAAQLAQTLERLRRLPPLPRGRTVAVNLPTYRLWAFDSGDAVAPARLDMRIIVGAAARTPTPLFVGRMRYLELNPYWNVPRSIAIGEILPRLARDGGYLRQNGMELVAADGRVLADGPAAVAALRSGAARVRQRPGRRNALGALKFAMPNPMNIYLHSTAATELFDRPRRDLSHGCIRVERPVELAEFVLADAHAWNAATIEAAIATAVTERDGRTLFAEDIYKRDAALIEALGY